MYGKSSQMGYICSLMTTDREALNKIFEAALKEPDPAPRPKASHRAMASPGAAARPTPFSGGTAVAEAPTRTAAPSKQKIAPPEPTPEPATEPEAAKIDPTPAEIAPAPTERSIAPEPLDRTQTTRELQQMLQHKNHRDRSGRKRMSMILGASCGIVLSIAGAWFLSDADRRESLFFSAEKIRATADMNRYASGEAVTFDQAPAAGAETATDSKDTTTAGVPTPAE